MKACNGFSWRHNEVGAMWAANLRRWNDGSPIQVLVIGKEKVDSSNPEYRLALSEAYRVGQLLARNGIVAITGGLGGVMDAVARGVAEEGGISVGIIPTLSPEERLTRPVSTHLAVRVETGVEQRSRIPMLVRSCHAVIVISGGMGAWLEAALALAEGIPIITLPHTGGTAARLPKEPPFDAKVLVAADAEEAVQLALTTIGHGG